MVSFQSPILTPGPHRLFVEYGVNNSEGSAPLNLTAWSFRISPFRRSLQASQILQALKSLQSLQSLQFLPSLNTVQGCQKGRSPVSSSVPWAVLHSSYSFSRGSFGSLKGPKGPRRWSPYRTRPTQTVNIATRLVGIRIILKCISNSHSILYITHQRHVVPKAWCCNYVKKLRTVFFGGTSIASLYSSNSSRPRPTVRIMTMD